MEVSESNTQKLDDNKKRRRQFYAEKDITKLRILQEKNDIIPEGDTLSTIAQKYVMCVVAAGFAESSTYPLDLTKTRLQIQGELAVKSQHGQPKKQVQGGSAYRGMFKTMVSVYKDEGCSKLWRGLSPAILRHAIYTGIRMGCYEQIRSSLTRKDGQNGFPLHYKVLCGMGAGGIGQLIASPTDLVKTQMQMDGRRRLMGLQPRVDGVLDAFRDILKTSGVKGLYRGCWPNVMRAALVNLGDLSTYDYMKSVVLLYTGWTDSYAVHFLSSGCAGLVGAVMATPFDVMKARIMNQPVDKCGKGLHYTGMVHCFRQTVTNEGLSALFKGFFPCWSRIAPWSLVFWLSYEQLRHLSGNNAW